MANPHDAGGNGVPLGYKLLNVQHIHLRRRGLKFSDVFFLNCEGVASKSETEHIFSCEGRFLASSI